MNINQYIKEFGTEKASRVASQAGSSLAYMRQIAAKNRKPGIELVRRLISESGHVLTVKGLRPDVYELVENEIKQSPCSTSSGGTGDSPIEADGR